MQGALNRAEFEECPLLFEHEPMENAVNRPLLMTETEEGPGSKGEEDV